MAKPFFLDEDREKESMGFTALSFAPYYLQQIEEKARCGYG